MAGIKKLAANLFPKSASKASGAQAGQKAATAQKPSNHAAPQVQVPKHNLNQPALPEGSKKSWIA